MTSLAATLSSEWLSLREGADNRARSRRLVGRLVPWLPDGGILVHDLGSGTGSMMRWLAPQLPGPQRWVLHDLDDTLLADALTKTAAHDQSAITVSVRRGDVTRLGPADLAAAALVTASALLDLLTADELHRVAAACVGAGPVTLLSLSVTGRVDLAPAHPLDSTIEAAFNAHQRRVADGRQLLGPDAVGAAWRAFTRLGADVELANTPWRLGPADVALTVEWLTGWVSAACEQRPDLTHPARLYLQQRLAEAAAGRLQVSVGHADLLAVPGTTGSNQISPGRV